jgi:hypothetical protein
LIAPGFATAPSPRRLFAIGRMDDFDTTVFRDIRIRRVLQALLSVMLFNCGSAPDVTVAEL